MKWIKIMTFLFFIFCFVGSIYFRYPLEFNHCNETYVFGNALECADQTILSFGKPLFYFSFLGVIASLLTFFLSNKKFVTWVKFAVAYILTTAFLVYLAPVQHNAPLGLDIIKEQVAQWLGVLFVIATLSYVLFQKWRGG